MAWTNRQTNTQTDMVDSRKNRSRSGFGEKAKAVHFLGGGGEVSGACRQCLALQGFTIYSGLLFGQGDVLNMLSSAMIDHVQWPIDGLENHVVHG